MGKKKSGGAAQSTETMKEASGGFGEIDSGFTGDGKGITSADDGKGAGVSAISETDTKKSDPTGGYAEIAPTQAEPAAPEVQEQPQPEKKETPKYQLPGTYEAPAPYESPEYVAPTPFAIPQYTEPTPYEEKEFQAPDPFELPTYEAPDPFSHPEYEQSEEVIQALNELQQIENNKPQGYESKYGEQLDTLLNQILGQKDFKYSFEGDEVFQAYKDLYTQSGKQASMDAMGQAAALTGGYGNSYAQQAGQQAYDEYLRGLYDKGDQFRQQAYQRYQDEQNNLFNKYNTLSAAESSDYARYMDLMNQWINERDYANTKYRDLRDTEYGRYQDERDTAYRTYTDQRDYEYKKFMDELNTAYQTYIDQRNFDYTTWKDERDHGYDAWRDQRDYEYKKWLDEYELGYSTWKDQRDYDYQTWKDRRDQEYMEWLAERDFGYDKWKDERDFGYDQWRDERDYDTQQEAYEEAKRQWEAEQAEKKRQFDESMADEQSKRTQSQAYQTAIAMLQAGEMPSDEMLEQAGLSKEDAKKLKAQKPETNSVSWGRGGSTPPTTPGTESQPILPSQVKPQIDAETVRLLSKPTTPQGPVDQTRTPTTQRSTKDILQSGIYDRYGVSPYSRYTWTQPKKTKQTQTTRQTQQTEKEKEKEKGKQTGRGGSTTRTRQGTTGTYSVRRSNG